MWWWRTNLLEAAWCVFGKKVMIRGSFTITMSRAITKWHSFGIRGGAMTRMTEAEVVERRSERMCILCQRGVERMVQRYAITPAPKPRMTQADKWKKRACVMRYRGFCDQVRALGVMLPESGADVCFVLPMPRSWSKKKRADMAGKPHTHKPDLSNLLKALEDAVYTDDARIWHYSTISKVWGVDGAIEIREQPAPKASSSG